MLHLEQYADVQAAVANQLDTLGDEQLEKQMRVPVTLAQILPVGVMGLFAAVIVMAAVSTDDTYLHSWGSIFVQDVVMPFRDKPLSPAGHMRLLRGAVVGVAAFAFCFSLVFPLKEYILMWFQITGAVFLGGAGAVLLGGLYWKGGTVEGAWAAMIVGPIGAVGGIVCNNILWPSYIEPWAEADPDAAVFDWLPAEFPFNGVEMSFGVAILCLLVYVAFSLASGRPAANMDKLLHRGRWAVERTGHDPAVPADTAEPVEPDADAPRPEDPAPNALEPQPQPAAAGTLPGGSLPGGRWGRLLRRIGMTEEFTRGDKWIFGLKFALFFVFFSVFSVVTSLHFLSLALLGESWFGDGFFRGWWAFRTGFTVVLGVVATIWFLIGGFRDLFALFRTLRTVARDATDDGSVRPDERVQGS